MLLSRSFLSLAILALCATALAELTPVVERRRHKPKAGSGGSSASGPGSSSTGPSGGDAGGTSAGPVKTNGDPGIKCEVISDFKQWTIVYDPIPPGCYEEGQKIPLKWTIEDATKAKANDPSNQGIGPSRTPVVQFDFNFGQRGKFNSIPAIAPVNGNDPVPVCAAQGSVTLELPPVGTYDADKLWPTDKTVYGLTAFGWRATDSKADPNFLNVQPQFEKLNAKTGFVIAAPGGCKDYPGGGQ